MHVTPQAVEKLKDVLKENGDSDGSLRVIAVPSEGGGVQYMMSMEKEAQKDDTLLALDGVSFLVDSDSSPFLEEATIDYIEDLPQAGFVISNPAFAAAGCACGNSSCGCGHSH